MDKRRTGRWFLVHKGGHTNEVIANALANNGLPNLPNETQELIYKGRPFPAWEVSYQFIEQVQESKRPFHLIFRVFRQRTEGGAYEEWFFHKKKKTAKKVMAVKRQVKKLCEEETIDYQI